MKMINEKQYNTTLDHRLLSKEGTSQIKDDFNTASAITKQISPIVIKNSEQLYDDVTLGVINKANNIAPNLTNKYILDSKNSLKIIGGVEVLDSYYGGSSPNVNLGTFLNGINSFRNEP
ncbi:hypothetical protein OZZ08_02600 [Malaciobacter mytili]|uniref:hypothetical protein n=1 Tax=Malaciobacter mytili TaxID=603050 RepID=UPI003BB13490